MNAQQTQRQPFSIRQLADKIPSSTLFLAMIFAALLFFELFNFSTTEYALRDLMGSLNFLSVPWATILALAFCGIDFAGIARLLSPNPVKSEPKETWFLFGAWMIAATMNAGLTWWGVAMAIVNHNVASAAVVNPATLLKIVPVFVAIMVWVIRILIIGSLSYTIERLLGRQRHHNVTPVSLHRNPANGNIHPAPQTATLGYSAPISAPKPQPSYQQSTIRASSVSNASRQEAPHTEIIQL